MNSLALWGDVQAPVVNAERLMLAGGVGAFLMTLYWVRVRALRERYAVTWLMVATLLLFLGLFPNILKKTAEYAHLSYPALVLFVSLGMIYINAFFVSVSLSKHYRWNVRITQQLAILEERLRRLENPEPGLDPSLRAYSAGPEATREE